LPWGRFLGAAVVIGIQPGEWRAMTPDALYEVRECWIEAQGGTSRRQARTAWAEFARLKKRYPDAAVVESA